jgi:hypothetical protein
VKELCPELSEVMDTVIKTVNYIKTHPLKSRLFAELCEEISHSCFTVILGGCQDFVARVYNLREVAALILEEENLVHAEHFCNTNFVS